jgi:hypothetical protein
MDVSTTKMCLNTSILAKNIMGRWEYVKLEDLSSTSPIMTLERVFFLSDYNMEIGGSIDRDS